MKKLKIRSIFVRWAKNETFYSYKKLDKKFLKQREERRFDWASGLRQIISLMMHVLYYPGAVPHLIVPSL
jgi:hypothetical protein